MEQVSEEWDEQQNEKIDWCMEDLSRQQCPETDKRKIEYIECIHCVSQNTLQEVTVCH